MIQDAYVEDAEGLGITADGGEGYLIAHDILEHNDESEVGGVANELEAIGAMWYVRGEAADFRRDMRMSSDPYQVLVNDLLTIVRYALIEVEDAVECEEPDYDFIHVRNECAKSVLKEFHDNEISSEERKLLSKFLRLAPHHMQNGYDWARKHYGDIDVNTMFHDMAEDIANMMSLDTYEFTVTYDTQTGEHSVDEIEWDMEEAA